jgi:hypothetical protein
MNRFKVSQRPEQQRRFKAEQPIAIVPVQFHYHVRRPGRATRGGQEVFLAKY